MDRNIKKDFKRLIKTEGKKIRVYLPASKTVGDSYDPFRNTGKTTEVRNPIFIKGIPRVIQPDKLIMKELGLSNLGALEILVTDGDANTLKLAIKIEIDGDFYVTKNEALGNKFVSFSQRGFGVTKVIVFKKEYNG